MTALLTLKPLLQQAYKKKKGRPAKSKPVYVSIKVEMDYTRELLAISRICQQEADALVLPEVGKNIGDAWFTDAVKRLKDKITGAVDAIAEKLAAKTVNAQKKESDAQLAQQLEKLTGLDLRSLFRDEDLTKIVDEAIAANVALIKSIPSQYSDKVEAIILKGLQEGKPSRAVAEDIKALGGVTDRRARLIARDQLGKINSRISQIRQQKLGITHYRWRTARDERVRSSHRLREGDIYAWDDPPPDGHAGQPINCRCTAEPYIDHLIDPDAPTPEEAVKIQVKAKAEKANGLEAGLGSGAIGRFLDLTGSSGGHEEIMADALRLTGLPVQIAVVSEKNMPLSVPMRYSLGDHQVEVNPIHLKVQSRGALAQMMAEELLHSVDHVGGGRTLSASSKRFNRSNGDVYLEALRHVSERGRMAEFLDYPINDVGLSGDRIKAELFARLGVLYFADPDAFKSAMPLAHGMYHELFGLSRSTPNSNEYVRSKIWTTAGRSTQTHGKHGADPADVPTDGSSTGNQSTSDLGRLRQEFARVMKASENGKKALL